MREHIAHGDGGRQGGHLAGTGFSKKTEFPKGWDEAKILDSAYPGADPVVPRRPGQPGPVRRAGGRPGAAVALPLRLSRSRRSARSRADVLLSTDARDHGGRRLRRAWREPVEGAPDGVTWAYVLQVAEGTDELKAYSGPASWLWVVLREKYALEVVVVVEAGWCRPARSPRSPRAGRSGPPDRRSELGPGCD
ncbi:hypothetical protein ACFYOT_10695 [Saccharothrix saharensis]|uniref:hypothetical protein n=1 Tax=Saccharothrix saharensis TaxID=571190 RepID=UPI00369B4596